MFCFQHGSLQYFGDNLYANMCGRFCDDMRWPLVAITLGGYSARSRTNVEHQRIARDHFNNCRCQFDGFCHRIYIDCFSNFSHHQRVIDNCFIDR